MTSGFGMFVRWRVADRRWDVVDSDVVRAYAASLPRTEVAVVRDRLKFRVRSIVYLALSPDETTMGFAFPKEERHALVASEPAKFHLPDPGDMRFNWCRATLSALGDDEARELVFDAWRMCVPKKVAAEYLAGRSGL